MTADIDVQDHDAQAGPHPDTMGAYDDVTGGQGIVEGGEIPYKPEALAKKKENAEKRMVVNVTSDDHRHDTGDPELKCCMPGVRAANYMPFPFQIVQGPDRILMAYEYARSLRTIYMLANEKAIPQISPPILDGLVPWDTLKGTLDSSNCRDSSPTRGLIGQGITTAMPCTWWSGTRK